MTEKELHDFRLICIGGLGIGFTLLLTDAEVPGIVLAAIAIAAYATSYLWK